MLLLQSLVLAIGVLQSPAPREPEVVAWKDLARNPSRHLGREVRLRVQMHSQVPVWNPYLTRFGAGSFACFQVWSDEQLPWVAEEFAAPAGRLFARRDGAAEWALASAVTYARCEVVAVVREVFLDRPWIEVREVRPLPERITEGTVIHAGRARELMAARSFGLARGELEQALSGNPPPIARAELLRMRAECERALAPRAAAPASAVRNRTPRK